jgi:hypothetical protein
VIAAALKAVANGVLYQKVDLALAAGLHTRAEVEPEKVIEEAIKGVWLKSPSPAP